MATVRYASWPLRLGLGALFLWQGGSAAAVLAQNFAPAWLTVLASSAACVQILGSILILSGFALRWAALGLAALTAVSLYSQTMPWPYGALTIAGCASLALLDRKIP